MAEAQMASSSSCLASFSHQVHNALCVVFATFKIETGEEELRFEEVPAAVREIQMVFGSQLRACSCVRVHWNKTAGQMLDFAREARLDRKDALFVFFLGPVANGWIIGNDGIGAPLQDLMQMFGCSSEDSPTFFTALHFPVPPGKLFRNPTAATRDMVTHSQVSLFRHQAYMWLASPEGLQEFLRLLKHKGRRHDLGLLMNEFAEWTRRGGDARALRLQRTLSRLVFLSGS